MVTDLIETSKKNIELSNISSLIDVCDSNVQIVNFSETTKDLIKNIKSFLFLNMYKHPHIQKWSDQSKVIIDKIFSYYVKNYSKIEKNFNNKESRERNISDYISGMTDKYAIDLYNSIK